MNPNSDKDKVYLYPSLTVAEKERSYPLFFEGLKFVKFRHISNMDLPFETPITVISGSNKCGKTSTLLAIACSHFNFKSRNRTSGVPERTRWGDVMRFTSNDSQTDNWSYEVRYREGRREQTKRGYRKSATGKWGGVAKKESQIGTPRRDGDAGGRTVVLIDLHRMVPARHSPNSVYSKARRVRLHDVSDGLKEYLSYIFEEEYEVGKMIDYSDASIYGYQHGKYSSFNTATGEDVLTSMLLDIVEAPNNSLILIEEIEEGLHPKIQRRLMDVIFHESVICRKQFIITTHSSSILASVRPESRLFIDKEGNNSEVIKNISINEALSRMDSESYPLVNVYVEDSISRKIVEKAIGILVVSKPKINKMINIVEVGSASQTYDYFKTKQKIYQKERINCGYACILDGDMRDKKNHDGLLQYPTQDLLFFHLSNYSPERMLVEAYSNEHKDTVLEYHVAKYNPHMLLDKMVELGLASSNSDAFDKCWNSLMKTEAGTNYLNELNDFLYRCCQHFAPQI